MANAKDRKQEGGEIVVSSPFLKWLDNFWYHYKWPVIIGAFFLFTFLFCFVQCATAQKNRTDSYICFSGAYQLTEEEQTAIGQVFSAIAPADEEGTRGTVGLLHYTYYNEDELRALYTDEDGNFDNAGFNRAKQYNLENYQSLDSFMMTGECSIWLVHEEIYQSIQKKEESFAVPLSVTFGEDIPENAYDSCAIRLGDTAIYQTYEALQVLPEDTLLVLTARLIYTNKEEYEQTTALYRAIVEFDGN